MNALTDFEIIGIFVSVLLAVLLTCVISYALNLLWVLLIPCMAVRWCCRSMTFDEDDEGTCCGCFGNNYVV